MHVVSARAIRILGAFPARLSLAGNSRFPETETTVRRDSVRMRRRGHLSLPRKIAFPDSRDGSCSRFSSESKLKGSGSGGDQSLSVAQRSPGGAILRHMKVEEIAEAVAKLPPDQLARFRRWFIAFEAGRTDHAEELDTTATKLGRLAGRAFAELKKRAKEP